MEGEASGSQPVSPTARAEALVALALEAARRAMEEGARSPHDAATAALEKHLPEAHTVSATPSPARLSPMRRQLSTPLIRERVRHAVDELLAASGLEAKKDEHLAHAPRPPHAPADAHPHSLLHRTPRPALLAACLLLFLVAFGAAARAGLLGRVAASASPSPRVQPRRAGAPAPALPASRGPLLVLDMAGAGGGDGAALCTLALQNGEAGGSRTCAAPPGSHGSHCAALCAATPPLSIAITHPPFIADGCALSVLLLRKPRNAAAVLLASGTLTDAASVPADPIVRALAGASHAGAPVAELVAAAEAQLAAFDLVLLSETLPQQLVHLAQARGWALWDATRHEEAAAAAGGSGGGTASRKTWIGSFAGAGAPSEDPAQRAWKALSPRDKVAIKERTRLDTALYFKASQRVGVPVKPRAGACQS